MLEWWSAVVGAAQAAVDCVDAGATELGAKPGDGGGQLLRGARALKIQARARDLATWKYLRKGCSVLGL